LNLIKKVRDENKKLKDQLKEKEDALQMEKSKAQVAFFQLRQYDMDRYDHEGPNGIC
jgi:hypothetical protein